MGSILATARGRSARTRADTEPPAHRGCRTVTRCPAPLGARLTGSGPEVSAHGVRFRGAGPPRPPAGTADDQAGDQRVEGLRLALDWPLTKPDATLDFVPDGAGGWVLDVARPPVRRFEYRLRVTRGGSHHVGLDPTNPASGAGTLRARLRDPLPGLPRATLVEHTDPRRGHRTRVTDGSRRRHHHRSRVRPRRGRPGAARAVPARARRHRPRRPWGLPAWACATRTPLRVAMLDPPPGRSHPLVRGEPRLRRPLADRGAAGRQGRLPDDGGSGSGCQPGRPCRARRHRRRPALVRRYWPCSRDRSSDPNWTARSPVGPSSLKSARQSTRFPAGTAEGCGAFPTLDDRRRGRGEPGEQRADGRRADLPGVSTGRARSFRTHTP